MAKVSSIQLTLLLVVVAAYSVQSYPHRQKRDLKFIKSFLYNTIFGKEPPVSQALPPLVIRHSPGKYRVIGIPEGYKSLYIRRYPQDVVTSIKDVKNSTADGLGILESYLRTNTQQESLSALENVNKLLQTGIITVNKETQAPVKEETVQPEDVQYEVPASAGIYEDGVFSYQLHEQPKEFSQTIVVPEPEVGSSVTGESRTSYQIPLSIVEGLQKAEQPVLSISSSDDKEVPAKDVISPVIVENVENVINIPKLETDARLDTLPIQPVASSYGNGFYYTQVQSDGSIVYYRDDGSTVHTPPTLTASRSDLIPKIPKYILERMQKIYANAPVNKNYSYKLVKNIDNGKLYLSRLSDKPIVNDIYAKGYTVIDNGYFPNGNKATYNVPSTYSYKQISLDGNTLYYNDNSKNNVANPLKSFAATPREFLIQRMKNLADNVDSRKYNVDGFDVGSLLNEPFTSRYIYKSVPVNSETYSKERVQNSREDVFNKKYPLAYYYKLIKPDGTILYYNGNNVIDLHDQEIKKEQKVASPIYPKGRYDSFSTHESSQSSNPYLSRVEVRVNEPDLKNNQKHPSDPHFYSYSQTGGNYLSKQSNNVVMNQEKDKSYKNVNQPTVQGLNDDQQYSTHTTHTDGQYTYLQVNADGSESKFENEGKDISNKNYSEDIEKDEPNKLVLYAPGQYSYVQTQANGETSNFDTETDTTPSKLYVNSVLPKLNEKQPSFKVISAKISEAPREHSTNIPKDGDTSIKHQNNNFNYIKTKFEGSNSVKVGLSTVTSRPPTNSVQSSYSYKLVQGTKDKNTDNHKDDLTTNNNSVTHNGIKNIEPKTVNVNLNTTSQNPLSLEDNPIVVLPIEHSYSYRGSNFDGSSVDVQRVDDNVVVDIRFGQHDSDENEDEKRGDV